VELPLLRLFSPLLHAPCLSWSYCDLPFLRAVACGNEIKSVVNAVERFSRWPMGKIDQTHMWQVRSGTAVCVEVMGRSMPRAWLFHATLWTT